MFEFLNLKPETFGMDISDLSLKIVKLKKHKKGAVISSFYSAAIKPGVIKKGEVRDEKALAECINKAIKDVKGKKINTKHVIASLPEEKSFLQIIKMPRLLEEDLKSAVIFEAENYIPLPVDQVYLDSAIIPGKNKDLNSCNVLMSAMPRNTVDQYVSSLKVAGLKPTDLEVESFAIARALIKKGDNPSALIIDLGATRTSFIIYSGETVCFTTSIPVSAYKLTESISHTMNVGLEEAEKLKSTHGLNAKEQKDIFESLIPPLTDLVEQIKKYLDYYQGHVTTEQSFCSGKEVEKIIICGGGANLKGLQEFLASELKLPVLLGNPLVNLISDSKKPVIPQGALLNYATAIGLALKGIEND